MPTSFTLATREDAIQHHQDKVVEQIYDADGAISAGMAEIASSTTIPDRVKVGLFELIAEVIDNLGEVSSKAELDSLRESLSRVDSPEQAELLRASAQLTPGQQATLLAGIEGVVSGRYHLRSDGAILPPRQQPGIGSGQSGSSAPPSGGSGSGSSGGSAPTTPASGGTPTPPASGSGSGQSGSSAPPSGGSGSGSSGGSAPTPRGVFGNRRASRKAQP